MAKEKDREESSLLRQLHIYFHISLCSLVDIINTCFKMLLLLTEIMLRLKLK